MLAMIRLRYWQCVVSPKTWVHSPSHQHHNVSSDYSKMLMAEAKKHLESIIIPSLPAESTSAESQPSDSDGPSQASDTTPPEASTNSSTTSAATSSEHSSETARSPDATASTSSSETPPAASDWSNFTPQTAIAAAHKATKQPGSSTACVLQLRPGSSILTAANLVSQWNPTQTSAAMKGTSLHV